MPSSRLVRILLGLAIAAAILVSLPAQRSETAPADEPRPAIVSASVLGGSAMQPDGAARTELPWLLPGDGDPVVSPDGRRLAFSSARTGNREIYVADATTGEVRRVTASPRLVDQKPAWSPDGRRIAWQAGAPGQPADVFVMRADGGKKRRLVEGPEPRHRPGVVAGRDAHRVRVESQRGLRSLGDSEGGRRAGVAVRRPRRGARARLEPGRHTARLQRGGRGRHEHLDPASRHARADPCHRLPPGGPAPGLVARREAAGLHPLRSRPLAHLGRPRVRRHRTACRGHARATATQTGRSPRRRSRRVRASFSPTSTSVRRPISS